MADPQKPPAVGEDVSALMGGGVPAPVAVPPIGGDVSHLMGDVPAGDLGAKFTVNGKPFDAGDTPGGWDSPVNVLTGALKTLWGGVAPLIPGTDASRTMGNAIADGSFFVNLAKSVTGLSPAHTAEANRMIQAAKSGDIQTAAIHAIGMLPLVGPDLANTLEKARTGHPFEAAGNVGGLALALGASKLTPESLSVPALAKNPNTVEQAAAGWAEREGVPLSAGQATGNRFLQGTEALADQTPVGAVVAERAKQAQGTALGAAGERIAGQVSPTPATAESAGQAVRGSLVGEVRRLKAEANNAYAPFDAAKAAPEDATTASAVALPVDVTSIKQYLRQWTDEVTRWWPKVQLDTSKGYTAAQAIINGPDVVPASMAERGLSGLKSIVREAQDAAGAEVAPAMRNRSQGLAARVVSDLEAKIDEAAAKGGVADSLRKGRAIHAQKMATADLLQSLQDEPVRVFKQATMAGDAGIGKLRAIASRAPDAMPAVGRAWLDDALTKATAEGGFNHADALYSNWQRLGSETKRLLFPTTAADLDQFFMAAKMAARQANPSRTALVGSIGAQGALIYTNPATGIPFMVAVNSLSSLLRSPMAVRALTQGLRLPLSAKVPATVVVGQILKTAADAGVPVLTPMVGQKGQ